MASEVYTRVMALVKLLTATEREALIQDLHENTLASALGEPLTREMIIAEHELLKAAGAFDNVESLRGKFAQPGANYPTTEELDDYLRQVGREWEEEMDELGGD